MSYFWAFILTICFLFYFLPNQCATYFQYSTFLLYFCFCIQFKDKCSSHIPMRQFKDKYKSHTAATYQRNNTFQHPLCIYSVLICSACLQLLFICGIYRTDAGGTGKGLTWTSWAKIQKGTCETLENCSFAF